MKIEVAQDANMALDGKSVLRSLQNNRTPRLDLFVRESIQNSLDAGQGKRPVKVEFKCSDFDSSSVSRHFEQISSELARRFPGRQRFLAIRDAGTEGLSGPVRRQDIRAENQRGNLRKLIYEIGKAQDMEGAGGSWGLGKTMYYRMGIGLVLYYSRFYDNKNRRFELRLAAALVEDAEDKRHVLPSPNSGPPARGIAWWGQDDPNHSGSTIPLTNEREIAAILDSFGMAPYTGDETGTTIIIPYIDEARLLGEVRGVTGGSSSDYPSGGPWWESSVEEYLNISAQRWYAPRINNGRDFGGRALQVMVNGNPIRSDNMEPTFRIVAELYQAARNSAGDADFDGKPIYVEDITLRNTFSGGARAGSVSYIRVNADDLRMSAPDNKPDPYTYVGAAHDEKDSTNRPIILYTRRPGMVVAYETAGQWIPSVQLAGPNEFVFGFFVPAENTLRQGNVPLEEYLRGCENADHMNWDDHRLSDGTPQTIISRIRAGVKKKIVQKLDKTDNNPTVSSDLGLGRVLADAFMPPTGFGYWDDARGGADGPGGTGGNGQKDGRDTTTSTPKKDARSKTGVTMETTSRTIWSDDEAEVPIRITYRSCDTALLRVGIQSETGPIAANQWERQTNTASPVEITGFRVDRLWVNEPKRRKKKALSRNRQDNEIDILLDDVGVEFNPTDRFGVPYSVFVSLPAYAISESNREIVLEGVLCYRAEDVAGTLDAKEIVDNDTNA